MLDYKAIGRRIAFYRKKINMTQAVLSEKLDITESYVSQIERGTARISLSRLDEIADILNVDIVLLISDNFMQLNIPNNTMVSEIISNWSHESVSLLIELLLCANEKLKNNKK